MTCAPLLLLLSVSHTRVLISNAHNSYGCLAELCALLREAAERGDTATWPRPAVELLEVADGCVGASAAADGAEEPPGE